MNSIMDSKLYLERLGFAEPPKTTLEGLNQLIYAHQHAIPFENLNVCDLHCGVDLDEEVLFKKIVIGRRGGYCFELNGLFCWLLQQLGFDAFTVFVRLRDGGIGTGITHRGILVRIGGLLHYVDVGKGDLEPSRALPLDGNAHVIDGATYTIKPDEDDDEWEWMFRQGAEEDHPRPYLRFSWKPRKTEEFQQYSDALSKNPESPFWKRRMLTLRTEHGFCYLRGDVYTEEENGIVVHEETIPADDDVRAQLLFEEKFGIILRSHICL